MCTRITYVNVNPLITVDAERRQKFRVFTIRLTPFGVIGMWMSRMSYFRKTEGFWGFIITVKTSLQCSISVRSVYFNSEVEKTVKKVMELIVKMAAVDQRTKMMAVNRPLNSFVSKVNMLTGWSNLSLVYMHFFLCQISTKPFQKAKNDHHFNLNSKNAKWIVAAHNWFISNSMEWTWGLEPIIDDLMSTKLLKQQ